MSVKASPELSLAERIGEYRHDPLGFVMFAFPWGQKGILEKYEGPDEWQVQFLRDLGAHVCDRNFNGLDAVMPVRMAVSSGHGIGKSVLAAFLFWWIMSTRPFAQGTVSANTFVQLQTKTWASIRKWGKLCITSEWFQIGAEKVVHRDSPENWFASAQSCKEENKEAFAGQHAADSTSFYLFDESSGIPDAIFDVADGGMTDGEPMQFRFGNPWRSSGEFYACCFGRTRNYWDHRCIDSRDCRFSNKQYLQELLEQCGEDSDRFRVQCKGLPPRASEAQFIDQERVLGAQKREVVVLPEEPLIMGVDLARGGADNNVIRYRRGLDARSIAPVIIPGEKARDSMFMVTKIAHEIQSRRPDYVFLDATGGSIGGPIGDRLRQLGHRNVIDVGFSAEPPDRSCANMRAYMWSELKEWLVKGAIDKSPQLEVDLTGPGFHADRHDKLVLESKEAMKARDAQSPDEGDALALTFSQPVSAARRRSRRYAGTSAPATAWS